MVFILFLAGAIVFHWISRDASFPAVKRLSTKEQPLPVMAAVEPASPAVSTGLAHLSSALNTWAVESSTTTKHAQSISRD
jgi:hypothetical protein